MVSNRQIVLATSLAISAVFLLMTQPAWKTLSSIESRQIAANDRFIEWRDAYKALLPINEKWNSSFASESDASDLLKLYRIANISQHGLSSDVDQVRQISSEPVQVNGMQIGVAKVCIATSGEVMRVSAPTMTSLRSGLVSLSRRKDISLGTVEVGVDSESGAAIGKIKPFCVLVRTGSQG